MSDERWKGEDADDWKGGEETGKMTNEDLVAIIERVLALLDEVKGNDGKAAA